MSETFTSQITRADIEVVVTNFYARARRHPVLGPVFDAHVTDWATHERRIAGFWAGALLRESGYSGNPMEKHLKAGNVEVVHFAAWLALFDEVLEASLPVAKAQHWSNLAHRIGRSLKFGLEYAASKTADAPPDLRLR